MKDFKEYIEKSKLHRIAEKVWSVLPEMQIDEDLIVGIREFELSINGINKNRINLTNINDKDRASFYTDDRLSVIDIRVGTAANLAHELSHMVYKYSENQKGNFQNITSYIHGIIKENESIIEYLNIDAKSNHGKLIGYLCLADDAELTANLAGFYLPHLLQKRKLIESDYLKKLKHIYNEMKEFTCSKKKIDEIIMTDKLVGIISKHLCDNDKGLKNPLNSNSIETLMKKINDQGTKFILIYNGLLEN